jgi:hypothetical protein
MRRIPSAPKRWNPSPYCNACGVASSRHVNTRARATGNAPASEPTQELLRLSRRLDTRRGSCSLRATASYRRRRYSPSRVGSSGLGSVGMIPDRPFSVTFLKKKAIGDSHTPLGVHRPRPHTHKHPGHQRTHRPRTWDRSGFQRQRRAITKRSRSLDVYVRQLAKGGRK